MLIKMNLLAKVETPFNIPDDTSQDIYNCPYTLLEILIMKMAGTIKNKTFWSQKIKNKKICDKWISEFKIFKNYKMCETTFEINDKLIKYIFDELNYYSNINYTPTSWNCLIEPASVDGTYQSDNLIPGIILNDFKQYCGYLENIADDKKDYHPGSNNQVINLVHPSLYPLFIEEDPDEEINENIYDYESTFDHQDYDLYMSEKYQWLPTDFIVTDNGVKLLSYINNLHPIKHKKLYKTIAAILWKFIPMFEHVLNDRINLKKMRIKDDSHYIEPENIDEMSASDLENYEENKIPTQCTLPEFKSPTFIKFHDIKTTYNLSSKEYTKIDLKNTKLQVIIKISSIILTPDKPKYDGGAWHVEGMQNENIIASGIYYYDNNNITPSKLYFRKHVCEPPYEQGDDNGVLYTYGLRNEHGLNQQIGEIDTITGRCIAFPNIYQHQVQSFELLDPTKAGHRKILVFFLINPVTTIISTSDIKPQQYDWIYEIIYDELDIFSLELLKCIMNYLGLKTLDRAKEYRLDLMKERKFAIDENTKKAYEREFSLCEH